MKKLKSEYNNIVKDILDDKNFILLKNDLHHGTSKYNHLVKVSKLSFFITKVLHLRVKEATKVAL